VLIHVEYLSTKARKPTGSLSSQRTCARTTYRYRAGCNVSFGVDNNGISFAASRPSDILLTQDVLEKSPLSSSAVKPPSAVNFSPLDLNSGVGAFVGIYVNIPSNAPLIGPPRNDGRINRKETLLASFFATEQK
jgi:hypothetical protein